MRPETGGTTRTERKLRDRLNYVAKRVPGKHRVLELYRLAVEADLAAEEEGDTPEGDMWRRDALYLRRLAHDLNDLRVAVRGDGGGRWFRTREERP